MFLQSRDCRAVVLFPSARKCVHRFDFISDSHFGPLRQWGPCSASAHPFLLQKSTRKSRTEGSSLYTWNIVEDAGTPWAESRRVEAVGQGIYRCSISVNPLPYSTLCSFNGRISLQFLLNLFLVGRENAVHCYDPALPGEMSFGAVSPLGELICGDTAVPHSLTVSFLVSLTSECSPVGWREENMQNCASEKEFRMCLVVQFTLEQHKGLGVPILIPTQSKICI